MPLGVAADGRTGYVSLWARSFAGVAAMNLHTGAFRPIWRFPDPAKDQADGAFSGRWLVWEQTYSLQSLDDFTVYAWNVASGRNLRQVVRIGRSLAGPNGAFWPSPWHAPAVEGNYAAWAQGYGPGGLVQIRLADLASGRVSVVAEGHLQAPFFAGSLLVWPASDRPGAETSLHAYSLRTRRQAQLPVALSTVRGTDFVAADGTRTAYLDSGLNSLYYSSEPGRPARVMLRLQAGSEFSGLGLGAGVLTWSTTAATYAASTATGGYVQVTPAYGLAVTGGGPDILVSDAPLRGPGRPVLPLHVVSLRYQKKSRCAPGRLGPAAVRAHAEEFDGMSDLGEPRLFGYLLGPAFHVTPFYFHAAAAVAAGQVMVVGVGLAAAIQDLAGSVPDRVDSAALAQGLEMPVYSRQADLLAAFTQLGVDLLGAAEARQSVEYRGYRLGLPGPADPRAVRPATGGASWGTHIWHGSSRAGEFPLLRGGRRCSYGGKAARRDKSLPATACR